MKEKIKSRLLLEEMFGKSETKSRNRKKEYFRSALRHIVMTEGKELSRDTVKKDYPLLYKEITNYYFSLDWKGILNKLGLSNYENRKNKV